MAKALWQAHFMMIPFFNPPDGRIFFGCAFLSALFGFIQHLQPGSAQANPLFKPLPFPHILESEAGLGAAADGLPAAC
jgi:hypothetical protein